MWTDYSGGRKRFRLDENAKDRQDMRMQEMRNAYLTNRLGAKLGSQEKQTAFKYGGMVDPTSGSLVPQEDPTQISPLVGAKMRQATTAADLNTNRSSMLKTVSDLTKQALSGDGSANVDGIDGNTGMPNLTLSSINPRGATLTNMNAVGQKEIMGEEAKGYDLQNRKVDAAIHAHTLLDAGFDPSSGTYNVSKIPISELGTAAANVITNDPGTDARTREEMRVKSAQGDWNGILSYVTGKPMNALTPENANMLSDIFERQGSLSEKLRNQHAKSVGAAVRGNSFDEYLKGSVSYQRKQKGAVQNSSDIKSKWGLV